MKKNEFGECSRKTPSSSGDDNDRPFKKAKYVWQLKGKYHLKEQYRPSNVDETSKSVEMEEVGASTDPENCKEPTQHQKEHCSCLTSLVAHSNSLLENDDSDQELMDSTNPPLNRPLSIEESHDEFLERWQARQVAKSYIDNTINTILDQCNLAPIDADYSENCDNGQVEDEGIMMAIQSHGLQSTNRFESHAGEPSNWFDEAVDNRRNARFEVTSSHSDVDMSDVNRNDTDQMEFLSTAVTMAIQKKGLSSYNYG